MDCRLLIKKQTSGGNALKFYASIRVDVRRIAACVKMMYMLVTE